MSKLPLDVKFSRLIVLGHVFGVLEESIIIGIVVFVVTSFSTSYIRHNHLIFNVNHFSCRIEWKKSVQLSIPESFRVVYVQTHVVK